MILDENLSTSFSVVGDASDVLWSVAVDLVGEEAEDTLGNTLPQGVGQGEFSLYAVMTEDLAVVAGGSVAVEYGVASADDGTDFTPLGSVSGLTAAKAGTTLFNVRLPFDTLAHRYLILKVTVSDEDCTGGVLQFGLVRDMQSN